MHYLDKTIIEIHNALLNKEITIRELVEESLRRAKNNSYNAFEIILEESALKKADELDKAGIPEDNVLYGIPYVAKDNFSTKDILTTASSNILNGYVPVFNATVIERLEEKKMILIGKSTLDELAMGGTGTTGHKGITYNPYDNSHKHLVGGSSCGSAAAVSGGIVPFALGSDTGDSVRKPASYAALVGYKPTWGRVSRYGLFPFAPSLDHVAYFTRSVDDSGLILNALSGQDLKDTTCLKEPSTSYDFNKQICLKNKKIAVIREVFDSISDENSKKEFHNFVNKLSEKCDVEYVSIDKKLLDSIYPAYVIISCAEATSNNANLDGIKFGPYGGGKSYQEVMTNSRTAGFSNLIKRRFVIGSYSLMRENQDELFKRAQKARRLIVNAFNSVLEKYDAIVGLAAPDIAPTFDCTSDKLSSTYLIADNYLSFANFGGQPSITIPLFFKDNLPVGINISSKVFNDEELLYIAKELEDLTGLKNVDVFTKEEK